MRVAKHDTAVGHEELFVDRGQRWELLIRPHEGETKLGRITAEQAKTYLVKRGPQSVLDRYFFGAKVETVEIRTPLALPAPEATVIPFRKEIAADSPEGETILAEANAVAEAADLHEKPKTTRKAASEKTARKSTVKRRAA